MNPLSASASRAWRLPSRFAAIATVALALLCGTFASALRAHVHANRFCRSLVEARRRLRDLPALLQDSNGDGIGDLNGITSRLGYLQKLGVDAIWIAPMYPSPQVDFGYDISNYESVDPQYGTLADMDRLIAEGQQASRPRPPRHGAQPHLRQAPVVHRRLQLPHQPQARLVRLERRHPCRLPRRHRLPKAL